MAKAKFITSLSLLTLLLSGVSFAQEPKKYNAIDGMLSAGWAGMALGDRWSTNKALAIPGIREGSPFKSANTRMAIQFSALGLTELLQHKFYPERRTAFRTFKLIMIGVGSFVIANNLSKGGGR